MKLSTDQCKFLIYLYHKGMNKINADDVEFPLDSDEIRKLCKSGYINLGMRNVAYYLGNEKHTQGTIYIEILFKGIWVCYLIKKDLYDH